MPNLAEQLIALRNHEREAQANFRALWQDTADLIFPRENQILSDRMPGSERTVTIYDSTAIQDSEDMASGLSAALIPTGQLFFGLKVKDRALNAEDFIKRYLMLVAEIAHDELFESNFMLQFNETLRSLVVFGTGNLFSEWDARRGRLNFKDHDISLYQIREDVGGSVDTVILSYTMTARQAIQEFGEENVSALILDAMKKLETENKAFEFIHIVRPRNNRNPALSDSRNMPWESIVIDVKAKEVVREGGFDEFPFSVPRWMKSSFEKYGRGRGTETLDDVKVLQQMKRDFVECGNRWNNPPRWVRDTFEGNVNVTPGALNFVNEPGGNVIGALDQAALGSFPITKEMLEFQQEIIHRAFYRDIFVMLSDLTQRMTTVEVNARLREGLRRLALPVARLQSELLNPMISRVIQLLIRNGRVPPPPQELQGQAFGIEYMGPLALALRDQQAQGFIGWVADVAQLEAVFPGVTDNVNIDKGVTRLGRSRGVNVDDMATEEEVAAKREERQRQMQAQREAELAQMAAQGYGQTNKAPESGSPAGEIMDALKE